jgi:thymidylate synthase (FAD)
MKCELIYNTPLWVCARAIRTCWDSHDKSDSEPQYDVVDGSYLGTITGTKDKALIERVGNKNKHSSVLRHLNYTFDISGISTKTLLAFTRHKAGVEFSVQSTRYTTKKRREDLMFTETKTTRINEMLQEIMDIVDDAIEEGFSNDDISMLLPQAYQYSCIVTMNAQAIQHFLSLRTKKDAHYDIRDLAYAIYEQIPSEHKYLFKEFLYEVPTSNS